MLTGEAKTKYMRDYMRRKRAGEPTAKPRAAWEPSQRVIDEIAYWVRLRADRPSALRGLGRRVIDGLTLDTDKNWEEACRRYKTYSDERRAKRKKEKQEAAKPTPRCCTFCNEPTSTKRLLWGNAVWLICESCVAEAAAAFAKER